jgi:hypothetical protein
LRTCNQSVFGTGEFLANTPKTRWTSIHKTIALVPLRIPLICRREKKEKKNQTTWFTIAESKDVHNPKNIMIQDGENI